MRSLAGEPENNESKSNKEDTMSTRSTIAMRLPDNLIHAIYCHNDGYLEGVGATLCRAYTDPAKVRALIELGALSRLGEELEPAPGKPHTFDHPQENLTVAYHRDRHEPLDPGRSYSHIDDYVRDAPAFYDAEYLYFFENGDWRFITGWGECEWNSVKAVLGARN